MNQPIPPKPLSKWTTIFLTFKAVAWSFLGIRKQSGHHNDIQHLNPIYVICAGLILTGICVISLIILVFYISKP